MSAISGMCTVNSSVSSHMGLNPGESEERISRSGDGANDWHLRGRRVDRALGTQQCSYPMRDLSALGTGWCLEGALTIVVHHSGLLLAAVHGEPDDLYLHEGVDDLETG